MTAMSFYKQLKKMLRQNQHRASTAVLLDGGRPRTGSWEEQEVAERISRGPYYPISSTAWCDVRASGSGFHNTEEEEEENEEKEDSEEKQNEEDDIEKRVKR